VHMGAYTHVHIHIYTQTWMHTCENVGTHAKSFSYVVICTSDCLSNGVNFSTRSYNAIYPTGDI
jgi:hypothetical protein